MAVNDLVIVPDKDRGHPAMLQNRCLELFKVRLRQCFEIALKLHHICMRKVSATLTTYWNYLLFHITPCFL
ncbi:hypothetical protein MBAV_001835 [Candidatus Magnetobacterium bavaricum]|uniref:Uncharacterized protein n=1 Tax=Candidatus Magnetobacterium bavaricum TaxID=29290 RepID=A0A0F3GVP7_9BACT|nr:hypothetical protein MBAV_001835 [Candidatus Magnetobacterium bavaricum]